MNTVLFDLYGTLVDISTDERSDAFWEEIARMLHAADAAKVRSTYLKLCTAAQDALGEDGEIELADVFEKLLLEIADRACAYRGDPLSFAHAFRDASLRKLRLFEGVHELIRGIHVRGGRAFLLSNAQACFTRRELQTVGLAEEFDGILLSSEAGCKKPSPRFFRIAFEKFSLDPAQCVYVGNDLVCDVGGAHAAGIPCIYIETAQSRPCEGGPVPDYAAVSRTDLAEHIFSLL